MNTIERIEAMNKIAGKRGELSRRQARLRESLGLQVAEGAEEPIVNLAQAKTQFAGLRRALDELERLAVMGAWDEIESEPDVLNPGAPETEPENGEESGDLIVD